METSQQELKKLSPLLDSLDKKVRYTDISDNYFINLENEIMSHFSIIQHDEKHDDSPVEYFKLNEARFLPEKVSGKFRPTYVLFTKYAAAAVLTGIVTIISWLNFNEIPHQEFSTNELNKEDIEMLEYVIEDIEIMAEYGLLEEEDLSVAEFPEEIGDEELHLLFDQF